MQLSTSCLRARYGGASKRRPDRALATYVEWRETTDAVADTYGRWHVAPAVEGATRFAAYRAALDQKQGAAGVYAQSISELERRLPG